MKHVSFRTILSLVLTLAMLTTHLPVFAVPITVGEVIEGSAALPSEDIYVMAEEESKRGTFEKHYLLSDGSFIAVLSPSYASLSSAAPPG